MGRVSETRTRKVTPPSPSYMSNDQFANYLADLRNNRVARPGGARPLGARPAPAPSRASTIRSSAHSDADTSTIAESDRATNRLSSQTSIAAGSITSQGSSSTLRYRDYYNESPNPLKPSEVVPTATYMERGQRWMEKEEANSLRDAMEQMELREKSNDKSESGTGTGTGTPVSGSPKTENDDETRIYQAALDEAAELVWQHQNGVKPRAPEGPYRYKSHLRKNSYAHARTASANSMREQSADSSGSPSRSGTSSSSGGSHRSSEESNSPPKTVSTPKTVTTPVDSSPEKAKPLVGSINRRPNPFARYQRRRTSLKRNISGEIERPFSGDQIWEEPENSSTRGSISSGRASPEKLTSRTQIPGGRVRFEPTKEMDKPTAPKPINRIEIQRNAPTQSRNPLYTTNNSPPTVTVTRNESVEKKNGMEIRSEDIRAATSMRLKDRSSKLPEPTAVSDSPGRPIVSFDANWKAPEEAADTNPDRSGGRTQPAPKPMEIPNIVVAEESSTKRPRASTGADIPSISIAGADDRPSGSIPQINIPSIAVDDAPDNNSGIPVVVTPDDKPAGGSRPLPAPGDKGTRRIQRPRGHWSPAPGSVSRTTTICHECGYPIEGRFVALRGVNERFHPQCFACFTCGTGLEAMEISPEPDNIRAERLERIQRRQAGQILPEEPGKTAVEDGDDRLRFFCHLDWHELYAPRCKHCHTPILGEHIVALGAHWHYGHFFCAECGDPFDHSMTHIEKDGYAWCINCQTKRTERRAPKCRKCKTAVIGQYIQALGGEWHESCFRCAECQGGFDDGQIFPKDLPGGLMVVLCTKCRTRELKM